MEQLREGRGAGLVVPRDNREAWKRALEMFASNPTWRAAWAACPVPLRTAGEMARDYLDLYLSLAPDAAH